MDKTENLLQYLDTTVCFWKIYFKTFRCYHIIIKKKTTQITYFSPVVQDPEGLINRSDLIQSRCSLKQYEILDFGSNWTNRCGAESIKREKKTPTTYSHIYNTMLFYKEQERNIFPKCSSKTADMQWKSNKGVIKCNLSTCGMERQINKTDA